MPLRLVSLLLAESADEAACSLFRAVLCGGVAGGDIYPPARRRIDSAGSFSASESEKRRPALASGRCCSWRRRPGASWRMSQAGGAGLNIQP